MWNVEIVAGLCYLPGRWNNDVSWALDPCRRPETTLAQRGIVHRPVRYRVTDLQEDKELLAACGTRDLLDDVQATVTELRSALPAGTPIFLAGYSLGAALACLAMVSDSFEDCAGLILLDGGLHAGGASVRGDEDLVQSPTWNPRFRRTAEDALRSGLSLDRYPPLLSAQVRDEDQLRYLLFGNDRWWPRRQLAEIARLADQETVVRRLAALTVPCLGAFTASETSSSVRCRRTLAALRRATVEAIELDPDWTHADVISHPDAPRLWARIAEWITGSLEVP